MNRRERLLWVGLPALLIVFVVAVSASPALPAEPRTATIPSSDYLSLFDRVFRSIQQSYVDKVDPKTLFEGAMKGLFQSLDDPHSYYMSKDQVQDLTELTDVTRGQFGGVGLMISKPPIPSSDPGAKPLLGTKLPPPYVEVVSPLHGTPAYRAGILPGDRIMKIDYQPTADMTMDQVLAKLRGKPGTTVTVTVLRGTEITFSVDLVRSIIQVPDVKYAMMPGEIAYLRIIQYTAATPEKVREALASFAKSGYSSLIIDERGNPGGLLPAVVQVASYLLPSGTIVSTRSRDSTANEVFTAPGDPLVPASVPIIVLIDKGSASASEILAAALHDNHRAMLVGQTSYGKGSVQQVFFLRDGDGAFKLTTARYYTPNGNNIDKIGIAPDKEVRMPELGQGEQDSLKILIQQNAITNFVRDNPDAPAQSVDRFIAKLHGEGIVLSDQFLRQLVRSEQSRMMPNPPIYDVEYDPVLKEAVNLLTAGGYSTGASR